ncbi:TonB-dependent receptor [Sphingosinicella microcystinivorans]|uniref:TonB-dependent receptor n=1 Tax=Sphingosinicella microcystinivorans TaxID=335406 RepID=UPI0022F3D40E|nr:TonB-dependent receptor [Sphingosinicella microcystinivorans]WBX84517.1 TonB-dependent receptor [Sphingosinicella microcystinivorans]
MKVSTTPFRLTVASALALAMTLPHQALAQDAAGAVDEIVVTARFRAEALTDVPIALSALSGDDLADRGLNNIQDIARSVPTVDFRTGASNKDRTVFIRGVGTISTSPGVEPSVSTVLDGVVLTRPGQSTLDLLDIERIEVLRGPQGTLFGKNASAGVINIVSKTPTNDSAQTLEASITDDNEYRFRAGSSGALVEDKLFYSLTGLIGGFDGDVKNVITGSDVNGYKRRGARAKIVAQPNEDLTLTFAADYVYTKDDVPIGVFVSTDRVAYPTNAVTANPTLAAILAARGIVPSRKNREISANFDTNVRDKNYGGSMQVDWRVGDFAITSITAYREWKNFQHQDWDGFDTQTVTGAPGVIAQGIDNGEVRSNQFSQELRLTSPEGGLVDYVVGLYFLKADTDEVYRRDITRLVGADLVSNYGIARYGITSKNYAVFGEANVNFTDQFRAIIGGRLLRDELSFYHNRVTDAGAAGTTGIAGPISNAGKTDDTDYTARLGLQYDLADEVVTYATFSRGYKGKAFNVFFNMPQNAVDPLDPETSKSYEVGLKANTMDRRLQMSLAAYITEFSGYQTNFQDTFQGAIVTRLTNAGDVSSRGIEADITFRATPALTLTMNGTYNKAKIDAFNCPTGATCIDFDGQPLPYAPRWKLFGDATYTLALSDALDLELQTDITYKTKTQSSITQTPDTIQPGYAIWNASVAIIGDTGGGNWQLRGFVRNITDKSYSSVLQYGSAAGAVRFVPRDDQRYFGLAARFQF